MNGKIGAKRWPTPALRAKGWPESQKSAPRERVELCAQAVDLGPKHGRDLRPRHDGVEVPVECRNLRGHA